MLWWVFFIGNQDKFLTNSSVNSINTRNKQHLHKPIANLSCFQKGASYSGIRIINNLPQSITSLRNEKPQFKAALKYFLYAHSFYSVDEFFAWLCKFSHCNNFICLVCFCMFFDMFHILLSGDRLRDLWNVYMYVCIPSKPDVWVYLKPVKKKKLLVLEVIANSMQNPSWETVASQFVQQCPTYHGTRKFNTMFKMACHSPYPEPDQGTPWCPIPLPILSVKFSMIQPHYKPKMHIIMVTVNLINILLHVLWRKHFEWYKSSYKVQPKALQYLYKCF